MRHNNDLDLVKVIGSCDTRGIFRSLSRQFILMGLRSGVREKEELKIVLKFWSSV